MTTEQAHRWPEPRIFAVIIVVLAVGAVALASLIVAPGVRQSALMLDLSGPWDLCSAGEQPAEQCAWVKSQVPMDVPSAFRSQLPGWLLYRRSFTSPPQCLTAGTSCALLLGEVGDAVEARLNGVTIGRHGNFPPHAYYSRHYPALFDLSRELLKPGEQSNELVLRVYAMKKYQTGIRRGPVAVLSGIAGLKIVQSRITLNILLPILGSAILFIISIITSLSSFWRNRADTTLDYYVLYCLAASTFLFSFSEVPREYLPIWFAGHFHFALRILFDWAYFEMVRAFFGFGEQLKRWGRMLYMLAASSFVLGLIVQFFSGSARSGGAGFDSAYTMMRLCFPLLLLPHALGLIGAARDRHRPGARLFIAVFAVLLGMQIWDILVFNALILGTYLVKVYAWVLGLVLGYGFLEKSRQDHSRSLLAQEQAQQMGRIHEATLEIAHDLRTPLASLMMRCNQLTAQPADPASLQELLSGFSEQANRIFQMTDSILRTSKELASKPQLSRIALDLGEFLTDVVQEFGQQRARSELRLDCIVPKKPVLASIDPLQFRRAIENLLVNAAEACAGREAPLVSITLRAARLLQPSHEITISDNGPGIPEQVRKNLFKIFVTAGKEHGIGLGLAATKRLIEAHGGTIEYVSAARAGATFRIRVPATTKSA